MRAIMSYYLNGNINVDNIHLTFRPPEEGVMSLLEHQDALSVELV